MLEHNRSPLVSAEVCLLINPRSALILASTSRFVGVHQAFTGGFLPWAQEEGRQSPF